MRPESLSVIVFAGGRYDAPLWTNRQQVATRLAARGWRVLYVEPRLFFWTWLRAGGRGERPPTLRVVAQFNLLPGSRRWPWVGRVNHRFGNAWRVRAAARAHGVRHAPLLVYDTEAAEFLDDFPRARVVYDCVDDHRAEAAAHGRRPDLVAREESAIAARANAIAVTTEPLRQHFSLLHQNVQLVPNAADVAAFATPRPAPDDMRDIPHPRVGTVGALDAYKIDVELLTQVAEGHPEWQFVLVGPVQYARPTTYKLQATSLENLRLLPNVHFLGPKPREQVPAYVHGFDVAIIPYRKSDYNRASFPLKFWEFMAAGKPVVAAGLPSLAPYAHLATLAEGAEAFAHGIADALARGSAGRDERIAEARKHDWSVRADAIEQLLRAA